MNTKALRQKVLDLAIHGKLVPQNPNDESATVLLEKIRAEKTEKIKKGELKADKKDSFIFTSDCEFANGKLGKCSEGTRHKRHYEQFADGTVKDIEDEIPFEVPEGWAWCRLTNVAITELGKTLDAKKNKGESYDYLCALNVKWYTFDFTTLKQIRLEEKEKERYLVRKGDLLICEGGDVGRSAIWESDNPIYYQNALHRVRFYQNINQYFFLHVLNYYKNIGLIDDVSGGVTIKHFTQNSMQKLLFPLPPLAEQEQIVSLIKTIFVQIEILEQNKTELQDAIKQTKSKILDLAIHGKLVPQDPNDEPAEQLLKRISTSDNRPYEKVELSEIDWTLPNNWCLCHFGDIATVINGKNQSKVENPNGKYPIYGSGGIMGRADDYICPENCTIIGRKGSINNPIFVEEKFWNVDTAFGLSPSEAVLPKFLFYFCEYFDFTTLDSSTTLPSLTKTNIQQIVFALPPIEEQKRILDKTNELFGKLDEIVLNLI